MSRGLALSDYDRDGDVDILIVDRDAGVRLLRNDLPRVHHWIEVRLRRTPGGSSHCRSTLRRMISGHLL